MSARRWWCPDEGYGDGRNRGERRPPRRPAAGHGPDPVAGHPRAPTRPGPAPDRTAAPPQRPPESGPLARFHAPPSAAQRLGANHGPSESRPPVPAAGHKGHAAHAPEVARYRLHRQGGPAAATTG